MKATINDNILAYGDRGEGLPLVLIHGFPLCRKMWRPQAEALARAGCRVITPDLRGLGESALSTEAVSMDVYADDLAALMDHLGIDKAVVGGMSLGGYVLLNLLERYPDRVAAPLFITTRAAGDDAAGKARRTALAEACLTQGIGPVVEAFRTILFAPETLTDNPALVREVTAWMAATDPRGAAAALMAMRDRKDYAALLGGIGQRALVIGAARDLAAPVEHARLLAEGLPAGELCILPGGGHLVNLEQPAGFNKAILQFLAAL